MHQKYGITQPEYEKLVEEHEYQILADKLKASLANAKIREGEYESQMHWLRESAKQHGLSVK